MRYAISNNKRVEARKGIEHAFCECCNNPVIPACGNFNVHHFRHISKKDCDSWYEPISDWHIGWQNQFPEECREVKMVDESTGISHRADIKLHNGVVIEVQNSAIEVNEVEQREAFYGKDGLVWIINGCTLIGHCSISYKYFPRRMNLFLNVNPGSPFGYRHINHFFHHFSRSRLSDKIRHHSKFESILQENGNTLTINFSEAINFENLVLNLENEIDRILKIPYKGFTFEPSRKYFEIKTTCTYELYRDVYFTKKYFRKFIDKMKCAVFIDKIDGLPDDMLYCYHSNSVLKKSELILNPREFAISL